MALSDHLRELRARLLKVAVILVVGIVVALFFFDQIFELMMRPYEQAAARLPDNIETTPTVSGAGGPLMLHLKLCGLAAVVVTSPLWLYQIWAFILPGLHANERKWTRIFAAIAGPLFLLGAAVGYLTLPKGLEVLIGFTPGGLTNLVDFSEYLTFLSRTLLVFGIAFEIPVFVILLNAAGVVSGRSLGQYRPWITIVVFVFAAVATPSADPFTMLFLAIPMMALFFVSEVICRFVDRRRGRHALADLDDDEMSEL